MHRALKSRIITRIGITIDRGDFINGAAVEQFEEGFAVYAGRRHCVGVSSGLDALRLALAANLEPGSGVVVPAATFAATFEAVIQAGGVPIVVDVSDDDYGMNAAQLDSVAGQATHALPVHLYGQLADMRRIAEIARTRGVELIEDACQAHGATRDGLRSGDAASAAAFSFYPAKNLGAMGDAGALVSDDEDLVAKARALRVHGETRKYHHELVGYTARLDTFQAIVLSEKLPLLDGWNAERRRAASFYGDALADLDELRLPTVAVGSDPVWHLYVVRTADPERLGTFLAERGIGTARHYPEPPHLAPAYRHLGFASGDFPVAEGLSREGLSLPIYPGIHESQLEAVSRAIHDYFGVGVPSWPASRRA
jgi:dTDP-4-amino-4,6-dideoxygalactose transaminase